MPQTTGKWIATSSEYRPDRYYLYDDLTELLHRWADEHSDIVSIDTLGTSFDGRKLWVLTITDPETGAHDTKPAYFVDALIHAGEVTGVAAVLWLLNYILNEHRHDDDIVELLKTTTLYVVPAINVDAMDLMMTGKASRIRSSVRPFPHKEQQDGLVREDLDGDGLVATMRLEDPDGPWKVSERDPRLMVKRGPDESGGAYYFLLPEGTIQNWDGGGVKIAPDLMGLDVNRNFPLDWGPHWEQQGAGDFPLSEPETRALAQFLVDHPNIHGSQHFHTQSGVILRPHTSKPDEDLPRLDVDTYKAIGAMGEEVTGYPCISIFHDFAYDKKIPIKGGLTDWIYEHLGAIPFATELWSLPKKAGVEVTNYIEFFKTRSEDVDVAMLKLLDAELEGEGFKEWTEFEHPQLGRVEIGGWDYQFAWQNPPGPWLEEVTSGNATFVLRCMKTAPRLVLTDVQSEPLGGNVHKISATVRNVGFLPTNVTEQGKKTGVNKPVKAKLDIAEGATLVVGKIEVELGHLEGRASQYEASSFYTAYPMASRAKVEWVVEQNGGGVSLTVSAAKAGTVTVDIPLGAKSHA